MPQILCSSLLLIRPDKPDNSQPDKSAFRLNFPNPSRCLAFGRWMMAQSKNVGAPEAPGDFLFAGMPLMLTLLRPSTASSALQTKKVLTARKSDEKAIVVLERTDYWHRRRRGVRRVVLFS